MFTNVDEICLFLKKTNKCNAVKIDSSWNNVNLSNNQNSTRFVYPDMSGFFFYLLKNLYFMLKIAKNGLILHYVGTFGFS